MATTLNCWESGVVAGASSLTLTKPSSASTSGASPKNVMPGDLLIIIVGNDNDTATAQWDDSTLKPTGFTLINEVGNATIDCHTAAFWRIADGTEGSTINVPAQSANDIWGSYILVSGAHLTTPLHLTGADVTDNTPPIAITGVTTTVADCLAFYCACYDGGDDGGFAVSGTGWAEQAEIHTGTGSADASGCWGTRQMSGTGATGTATVTPTTGDGMGGFQFAIAPNTGPVVTDVETDEDFRDGDTGVTVTGVNFGASQGNGKVELGNNAVYASATKVEQTVTSWGATAIDITAVLSTLTPGALYLFVTDNAGAHSVAMPVSVHRKVAFILSASTYIGASGENTTARLTTPSATFGGGRIQDDENPTDTVDIDQDERREDEWCLKATDNAATADYDFRLLVGSAPPNSITQTPTVTISAGQTVTPSPAFASLTIAAPTVTAGAVTLTPDPAPATLVPVTPVVSIVTTVTPSPVSALFIPAAPTVTVSAVTATPSPASALFIPASPAVTAGAVTLAPDPAFGTLAPASPTVTTGAVTLTPAAAFASFLLAAVTVAAGAVTLAPDPASATYAVVTPAVTVSAVAVTPDPVSATWAIAVPEVSGAVVVAPDPVNATFVAITPTVSTGAVSLSPDPVSASYVIASPTVTSAVTVYPDPAAAVFALASPTVSAGAVSVTPDAAVANWQIAAPTISTGAVSLTPDPASALWFAVTPQVTVGAATLTPDPAAATFEAVSPTVTTGAATVAPDAAVATYAIAEPIVSSHIFVAIDAVSALWAAVTPTVSTGAVTLAPDPAPADFAVASPAVTVGAATLQPDPVAALFVAVAVSLSTGPVTLSPDPASALYVPAEPIVTVGAQVVLPDPVAATWALAAPAVTVGAATLTPDPVTASYTTAAPTVSTGAVTLTPNAASALYVIVTPTVFIETGAPTFAGEGRLLYAPLRLRTVVRTLLREALMPARIRVAARLPGARLLIVPVRDRLIEWREHMVLKLPAYDVKRTAEQDVFAFDLVNELGDTETISTATFAIVVAPDSPVPDGAVGSMLSGSSSISGSRVFQKVQAGVDTAIYILSAQVTTSTGRVLEPAGRLPVRNVTA